MTLFNEVFRAAHPIEKCRRSLVSSISKTGKSNRTRRFLPPPRLKSDFNGHELKISVFSGRCPA